MGLVMLAFVACIMTFFYRLSGRDTEAAIRHETKVQDRSKRHLGLFYADADDPRVWVPRPQGNGWDPNLATVGGKAIWGALGALVLLTVGSAVVEAVR